MAALASGGIVSAGSRLWADDVQGGCYIPRPPLTPCEITRRSIRTASLLAATRIVNNRIDNDEE